MLTAITLSTGILHPSWEVATDRAIKFWSDRGVSISKVESEGDIRVRQAEKPQFWLGRAWDGIGLVEVTPKWSSLKERERTLVVAHEIGHILGLEHTNKAGDLMFPELRGGSQVTLLPPCPAQPVESE